MLKQRCTGCGKPLESGSKGKQCSLCALGLAPGRQVDLRVDHQVGLAVGQRDDTGIDCPRCHAHLSFADVARRKCAYCHATVAQAVIPTRPALQPHWRRAKDEPATPVRIWPENAPIR